MNEECKPSLEEQPAHLRSEASKPELTEIHVGSADWNLMQAFETKSYSLLAREEYFTNEEYPFVSGPDILDRLLKSMSPAGA